MRVLVACEFSGRVRDAFLARGHDAWSCDLLPTEVPDQHIVGDALEVIARGSWDLLIAHPPCTYLANSGAKHLYIGTKKENGRDEKRWRNMEKGAKFFKAILESPVPRIAVENPIMLGCAREIIGVPQSQVIQPWMFGHPETKATCLWLSNLPLLKPTSIIRPDFEKYPRGIQINRTTGEKVQLHGSGYDNRVHFESPGPERWKNRSRTLPGIAAAMAEQWG